MILKLYVKYQLIDRLYKINCMCISYQRVNNDYILPNQPINAATIACVDLCIKANENKGQL